LRLLAGGQCRLGHRVVVVDGQRAVKEQCVSMEKREGKGKGKWWEREKEGREKKESATHPLFHRNLTPNVPRILTLQHRHQILRQRFVPPTLHMHPLDRLALDHPKVKLILVPEGRLLPELVDTVFLRVEVAGSLDVVGVFLEESEFFAVCGLGTFAAEDERGSVKCTEIGVRLLGKEGVGGGAISR
jgi:hypothetical protein